MNKKREIVNSGHGKLLREGERASVFYGNFNRNKKKK